jgi:hypothetical protein
VESVIWALGGFAVFLAIVAVILLLWWGREDRRPM